MIKVSSQPPMVTWSTLRGKPSSFPPAAHTHAWSDITGKPTSYPPAAHTHLWADITDKPNLYPPSAHTHLWADIADKPTSFMPSAHTHPWTDVTGKPATYPPSAHTHLWADITDRPTIPAATPLGTATPQPLGTAAAGSAGNAAREDHVHPLPSGRLQLVGTYSVGEAGLVTLALAVRRYSLTITGLTTADRIMATLNGVPQNGSLQDVFVSAANTLSVGALVPTLGVATTVAIPIAIYKVV